MNQLNPLSDSQRAIAVIGMACRLPGAPSLDAYRSLLRGGRVGIVTSDDDALRANGIPGELLGHPHLVRRFGVLDKVDAFDAAAFGIPPARAAVLDPQQRILLELAVGALEHAGYVGESDAGSIGVYVSLAHCSYRGGVAADSAGGFFGLTASDKDYGATRISYALDLTGPSMTVQSACSGSLAAVHMAVEALLSGQCDLALAGGASILLPQGAYLAAPGLMLAPDGECRPFDAAATGTVPGNGAGLVVLKRLDRALADADTIHAVILGSAIANDGARKVDYLAPGIRGQMRAVGEAWSVAGIEPSSLGMIEAHGTGTRLGDPIEITALKRLFGHFADEGFSPPKSCRISSVKANIGHLNVASGIAGFIKAVLSVRDGVIPGIPGFQSPNPEAGFADTPLQIGSEPVPWLGLRRAGVSSFGFGGTNVHVVLEQPPQTQASRPNSGILSLPLSAHDSAGLERVRRDLADHLRSNDPGEFADIAYTLQRGRAARPVRAMLQARDIPEASALLEGAGSLAAAEPQGSLGQVAQAWMAGESLEWGNMAGSAVGRRIPLPTYPFADERHWLDQFPCWPLGSVPGDSVPQASRPTLVETPAVAATQGQPDMLEWLRQIFSEVLQCEPASLSAEATYDRLGVDSLLVVSITGRVREFFPEIRGSLLFEHKTLVELAIFLNGELDDNPSSLAPFIRTADAPAPIAAATSVPTTGVPIAIIGMAGHFPGADDIHGLWGLLENGRTSIEFPPQDRQWDADDGTVPRRRAAFIREVDRFDALFFGIAPTEARRIDPQARLFLETAWAALEDAGRTAAALKAAARRAAGGDADVGVFAGVMNMPYRLLAHAADAAGQVVQANHWSVANRVSYHFDFTGPSLAVDTACSASLAALHLACESLRRGECGVALAGGVNLILDPVQQRELVRMGMLSPSDVCHSFGAGADGFVQGEGVGVAVLKTLDSALADGDRILGVILGSATNANGRTGGYTVPNPKAQAAVIRRALAESKIPAESISAIECHGTGTALGDPIEIAGLAEVFATATGGGEIAIGSIKSNMGHLESAAGVAGLAKLLLQFEHRRLAPSLNAEPINPELGLERTHFRVQTKAAHWHPPRDPSGRAYPRRAGLSGFGAGGANLHLVLEEAPELTPSDPPSSVRQPIVLSAADADALQRLAQRLAVRLTDEPSLACDPSALADLAHTLAVGRTALAMRAGFLAHDRGSLIEGLRQIASGKPMALAEGEPDRLIAEWIVGKPTDWGKVCWLGERRQLIRLPTYPFAGPRLWLKAEAHATAPASVHNPWLTEAQAGETPAWRFNINATMPLLDQHRVGGVPYLPGVVSVILALSAAETAGIPAAGVANVIWKRPVTPGEHGLELILSLPSGRSGRRFRLGPADGGETFVEGRLIGTEEAAEQISDPVLGIDALAWPEILDQEQVRRRLVAAGLSHGPALRAIKRLCVDAGQVIAELELPEEARRELGDWHLCPSLLDSAFQAACMVLLPPGESAMPLPLGIERLSLYGKHWPDRLRVHARLMDRSAGYAQIDILIGDAAGSPLCRIRGLTARLLPKTANEGSVPLFVPRWRVCAGESAAAPAFPPDGSVAIIAPQQDTPLVSEARKALADRETLVLGVAEYLALPEDRRPGDLLYVHPIEEQPSRPPNALSLLELLAALNATSRPINLVLLSLKVHRTQIGERTLPWAAASIGLARTAMRENARLNVVCIDLGEPTDLASALKGPADPLGLPLAWRDGRRWVLRLDSLQGLPVPAAPPVTAQDHILIIGGAGGIGLALAKRWSLRHGSRFTLIGRRGLVEALEDKSSGIELLYLQADVTDADALAQAIAVAEVRQGPVTGTIHAALIMQDRAIRNMSQDDFLPAFEVKRLGLHNLYECLRGRPLRWLCVFSSVNSFVTNAGQSNYVAGCVVQDAMGLNWDGQVDFPVRIVNWGYWGEVGRVATEEYRKRMARIGVNSIGVEEGFDALEKILAGNDPQVLAIRVEPEVLEQLGYVAETSQKVTPKQAKVTNLFAAAQREALAIADSSRAIMAGATEDYRELDTLAVLAFARWWQGRDWPASASPAELAQSLGLAEEHRLQFDALLDMLTRHGFLAWQDDRVKAKHKTTVSSAEIAERISVFLARSPQFAAHFSLIDACLAQYASILRGETAPTEVLFPNMSLVEGMYRGNRMVDHFNDKLAAAVAVAQKEHGGEKPFRVLEFGSGTGGTSQRVLPALGAGAEYDYTDISPGFLIHGKKQFKAAYPFMNFKLFNLENPPDPAEFPEASYDVLFGANVIHATRSLSRSLGHVARLIRPGGLLMLYEMVANHDFVTLTFGILPGWWLSEDSRLPHGPLLDPVSWRKVLIENGFDQVGIFGQPEAAEETQATHALIVARRADPAHLPAAESNPRRGLLRGRLRKGVPSAAIAASADLEKQVLSCVAATLEISTDKLDPERSLADYGADSIIGVQMVRDLNRHFNVELKPTTLFSHPSVQAVALHLATHHGVEAVQTPSAASVETLPTQEDIHLEKQSPANGDAIAVIGMAGRFPGAADIDEFWQLLADGVCSVGPVPAERWDHSLIYDPKPLKAGRSICPEGGFISNATGFDPGFFGLSPAEATAMDPQQRLFLMTAWHALEDAGLPSHTLKQVKCGVYAGNVAGDYGRLLEASGHPSDAHTFMGSAASMLPARIAYHLDLTGPALSIDTACSSSLVAIAEACEALRGGRCALALAGGVAAMFTPGFYVVASNAGMLSPTARCHTLDAAADGFVPGEAVAVVALKRLDRALADQDRILGVIRGWGVNQDGTSNGITAPSAPAQSALIRGVHERFGIDPNSIDYVELHGTGTRLGDPVEMEGLSGAFGPIRSVCGVGSVKSNIGHTLAAAGAVGLIKVLLALRAEALPPSLHFRQLNPAIDLAGGAFQPVAKLTPWPRSTGHPRRAGVSAFGFAGTNAHLVVEEAPLPPNSDPSHGPWLFPLSARTSTALQQRTAKLLAWLDTHPDTDLSALSATLTLGRSHFKERTAWVGDNLADLTAWLAGLVEGRRHKDAFPRMVSASAMQALADAYIQGGDLPLDRLWQGRKPVLPSLPGYPFDCRDYRPTLTPRQAAMLGSGVPLTANELASANTPRSILTSVTEHLDRLVTYGMETGA